MRIYVLRKVPVLFEGCPNFCGLLKLVPGAAVEVDELYANRVHHSLASDQAIVRYSEK